MAVTFTTKPLAAPSLQSIAEDEPIHLDVGYAAQVSKSSKNLPNEHTEPNTPVGMEPVQPGGAKPKKRITVRSQARTRSNEPPRLYSESSLNEILGAGEVPDGEKPLSTISKDSTKRIKGTKESVEFRRKQVLRLVLRGVPKVTIAEHLGITANLVYSDMTEITRDMREELRALDYPGYIGMSLAFYDECRSIALRLATDNAEKSNGIKMQALRTAIVAEDSKHNFLSRVGLYKVTSPTDPFNSIQSGRAGSYSDENDISNFLQSIAEITLENSAIVDVTPKQNASAPS